MAHRTRCYLHLKSSPSGELKTHGFSTQCYTLFAPFLPNIAERLSHEDIPAPEERKEGYLHSWSPPLNVVIDLLQELAHQRWPQYESQELVLIILPDCVMKKISITDPVILEYTRDLFLNYVDIYTIVQVSFLYQL